LKNNYFSTNELNKISYKSVSIKNSNDLNKKKINILFNIFKNLKNHLFNILSIFCFIFSVYYYILSLEKCKFEDYYQCDLQFDINKIEKLKKFLFLSTFFYSIYLFLCIHKIIN